MESKNWLFIISRIHAEKESISIIDDINCCVLLIVQISQELESFLVGLFQLNHLTVLVTLDERLTVHMNRFAIGAANNVTKTSWNLSEEKLKLSSLFLFFWEVLTFSTFNALGTIS